MQTDVGEFKSLLINIPNPQTEDLKKAASLYQGELLAGLYEDWIVPERLNLGELYFTCIKKLTTQLSNEGRYEEALNFVAAAISHDPLDADLRAIAINLHILAGRPVVAIREYEDYEKVALRAGEQVSAIVRDVLDRARLSLDQTQAPEPTRETCTVDFEARNSSDSADGIEAGSASRLLAVPRYCTDIVGRDSELQRILSWSESSGPAMLTILGVGGCGKTRLASHAARALSKKGRSVFWISLASVESAGQILPEVVRAVAGSPKQGDQALHVRETLARLTQPVIFLDNLEHLSEGAVESCLDLLGCLRGGHVIATSRRRLGIGAETILQIMPLPVPEDGPIDQLAQNPSIALFLHRAQSIKQDFQLTERTAPSIVRLCGSLEGLPLALELAASWARTLSPSQMLERVSDRMNFLATNRKDIPERHRSIRATIDSSFELLSLEGRELFKRASVFRNGWSLDAARAIAPAIDVDSAIEELTDCSIAIPEDNGDEVRFYMLETLTDYASRLLSPDHQAEVAELHAAYFLEFTRRAELLSSGLGARKLDLEYRNVIAALRHFMDGENWECALELGELLGGYWEFRGRFSEGLEYLLLLERGEYARAHELLLARIRTRIAKLAWEEGLFDLARSAISLALESLRPSGRDDLIADALFQLQKEEHRTGRYEVCRTILDEAVALGQRQGSPYILSTALRRAGNASIELQDYDRALREYEESLSIARRSGHADLIGPALSNLGYLGCLMGRLDAAREWIMEAEAVNSKAGRSDVHLDCLVNRIHLERLSGHYEEAFRVARELFREDFEGWTSKWEPLAAIGLLCENAGMYAEATVVLGYSLQILEENYAYDEHLMLREVRSHLERCATFLGERRYKDRLSRGRTMGFDEVRRFAKGLTFVVPAVAEPAAAD